MSETHKRTIARMVSYRLTALLLTIPFTYYLTGDWLSAIEGSILLHIILSLDYYVHERVWLKIKWGKIES